MEPTIKTKDRPRLQPETILPLVADSEEQIWSVGGLSDDHEQSLPYDSTDLGHVVMQHGGSVKNIHSYFAKLEQRKCCLLLAACRQRFTSVRLVRSDGRDSGIEEGAMMKTNLGDVETVTGLDEMEFKVFQSTLMCAAFPVLGAPEPPRATPSPRNVSVGDTVKRHDKGVYLMTKKPQTPHVMTDSGVEDQEDDNSMVPAETLCELLRRAFRLTPERFAQYEELVAAQMEKKSPQKILAEELVRQLVALENNSNNFYNPKTFMNRLGYDQWQHQERSHITELLNKFWHFSLPQPSTKAMLVLPVHTQYKLLMEKLIRYESPHRQQSEILSPPPKSPLSSASVCLLKEFSLRYGVGEQYTRIIYLHHLAENFDPSMWFIQHVTTSLTAVMEAMPSQRSFLVIVKEEYTILEKSLHLLDSKCLAAIAKMKTLYTDQNPTEGIEGLIELVSLTIRAKSYLLMTPEEQLGNKLFKIIQTIFPATYERHKITSKDELRQNKWEVGLSPKLINMMIGHIRDEVQDYKQNYQQAFSRFFSITVEAAQEFYRLLMADVAEMLQHSQDKKGVLEIDRLMLSLAYRLNQLDQDWATYINSKMQTWREIFLLEAQYWGTVLKHHMHNFITMAVSVDKYTGCEVEWVGSLSQSSINRITRNRTASSNLSPSQNSAFSSLSSAPSQQGGHHLMTLVQPTIKESFVEHSPKPRSPKFPVQGLTDTPCDLKSPLLDRRPSSDPVNISHSSMVSGSYLGDMARSLENYDEQKLLSFTHVRHSSSLPDFLTTQRYIEMVPTTNKSPRDKIDNSGNPRTQGRKTTMNGDVSPEISELLEEPVKVKGRNDSDDSGTLTEDSGSPDNDYHFPPIEEIKSSTPVGVVENKPVTVISEMLRESSIIRPVVSKDKKPSFDTKKQKVQTVPKFSAKDIKNIERVAEQSKPLNIYHGNQGQISTQDNTADLRQRSASVYTQDFFTDSLRSNISFPHPLEGSDRKVANFPLSSATVDVIVMLQRMVGLGKALSRTLAPLRSLEGSDMSQLPTVLERDSCLSPTLNKSRNKLYDIFLQGIRSIVCVFADNMLCMDLCGTSNAMARRLAGPQLVQYLQTQQASDLIWGCRHDLTGNKNCFEFLDKESALLCDRHEPITRDMCTRINNVMAMLTCLEWYHHHLGNVFGIFSDLSVKQLRNSLQASMNSMDMLRGEFVVLDDYGYDPSKDKAEVMETASQLAPSIKSGCETGGILVTSPIDPERDHLKAVLRAQCRIMAYRLNLFVRDALPVLLTFKSESTSLDVGLKPITDFLSSYFLVLNQWLYKDSFIRVLECLWIFIVRDFEEELGNLERADEDTERKGQLLLQSLAHFLRFMNNQNEELKRELLLSQAEDVSFRLSLYSMPVQQLITVYRGLIKDVYDVDSSSTDSDYLHSVLLVRAKLRHDLQTLRKGFSGTELVRWVLQNQELFANFDPILSERCMTFTSDTAILVAQQLVEWGLIADVEGDKSRNSPTLSLDTEYPGLTIHTEVKPLSDRPFSRLSDEDSTPQATPRATPHPPTRTNLRTLSRQSGLKSLTPGLLAQRANLGQGPRSKLLESSGSSGVRVLRKVVSADPEMLEREGNSENEKSVEKSSQGLIEKSRQEVMQDFHGNSQEVASWDSIDSEPSYKFEHCEHGEATACNFDPYARGTPMSIGSGVSCESRAARFIASSDKFYYICPNVGNEVETSLKNYEVFRLVEECFQKKITPEYILRIVYSRRKSDGKAKQFLKMVSPQILDRIRMEEDVTFCTSS